MIRGSISGKLHRWVGIGAALWIALVGITGFLLDHKDWRWMRQATLAERWLPESLARTARDLLVRFYQVDPADPRQRVSSGWRGTWYSTDGGKTWVPSRFEGLADTVLVYALEADFGAGGQVWLATDDGVWLSPDRGATFRRHALPGQRITSISRGPTAHTLYGVIDRSSVFTLDTLDGGKLQQLTLAPPPAATLSKSESLGRVLVNLHLGWGLLPSPWGLWLNDIAAVGIAVLPLTGLFVWLRRRSKSAQALPARTVTRWLLRVHVYVLGFAVSVPLIYFAASGLLLIHRDWRSAVDTVRIEHSWLPPGYHAEPWRNEVSSVIGLPGDKQGLMVATRRGLFTTFDEGKSWRAERLGDRPFGAVFGLRRAGDEIFAIGAVSGRCSPDGKCASAKGLHGMVSDVFEWQPGRLASVSHHGIQPLEAEAPGTAHTHLDAPLPALPGVPAQFVINQLHSTALFFGEGKRWVNDLGALVILLMIMTGLWRWQMLVRRGRV